MPLQESLTKKNEGVIKMIFAEHISMGIFTVIAITEKGAQILKEYKQSQKIDSKNAFEGLTRKLTKEESKKMSEESGKILEDLIQLVKENPEDLMILPSGICML